MLGESYWSQEENLNLLNGKELCTLFSDIPGVVIDSVKLFYIPTNLIAYKNIM
jgi:hypothetical protein